MRLRYAAATLAVAAGIYTALGATSTDVTYPTTPSSNPSSAPATGSNQPVNPYVGVATVVDDHSHSILLRTEDVASLLSSGGSTGGSVTITSSTGFDGGIQGGTAHQHDVTLQMSDLQTLQSSGSVDVESQSAMGHTHTFHITRLNSTSATCPSPSVSPTRSPSPRPSPSVSPTRSPLPSPSPSISPTRSPLPSPSPTRTTGYPGPILTFTPNPSG